MAGAIKKKLDDHLYLKAKEIISEYKDRPKNGAILYFTSEVMIYMDNNSNLCVLILRTGEEFKIPSIIFSSLHNLRLDDSINSYKDRTEIEDLIISLHYISNNLNGHNLDKVVELLYMIRSNDLLTKELRDIIYSRLKILPGYIEYSSPYDSQFY